MDIYLYGMVLMTRSMRLRGNEITIDGYNDAEKIFFMPGGETGVAAIVLRSLGCSVRIDGNHLGNDTYPPLADFYTKVGIDFSPLTYDKGYSGLIDYVMISGEDRTCFGEFGSFYASGENRWNTPNEQHIKGVRAAGIDPFYGKDADLAAFYCIKNCIKYVTIDCEYNSYIAKNASVAVISGEYVRGRYPNMTSEQALKLYTDSCDGLIIITGGKGKILYGRKGEQKTKNAFKVKVQSTLGAGDTFKAGCVFGLYKGLDDDRLVETAAACASTACSKFPIPTNPPTLEEVNELIRTQGSGKLIV